jgi:hypothetical protein
MKNELSKVRSHLAASRSAKGRVPAKVRREVLVFVERARAAGASYREIAKEIDVSIHTLMGWRQRDSAKSAVQPVRVRPTAPAQGAVVRGPRGLEVDGLTVAELAELWVRLS